MQERWFCGRDIIFQKMSRTYLCHSGSHFLQLIWAYVRTEGEAKIHQRKFAQQILVGKWPPILVKEFKGPSNGSFPSRLSFEGGSCIGIT